MRHLIADKLHFLFSKPGLVAVVTVGVTVVVFTGTYFQATFLSSPVLSVIPFSLHNVSVLRYIYLFMLYSGCSLDFQLGMIVTLMNGELETVKGSGCDLFNVLSRRMAGCVEEKHENISSG